MKKFEGKVLFLDRTDINTDEIIPARYLTEISKEALKPHLLEDLKLEGFSAERNLPDKNVIITRNNFGCGSSREHAVWALEVNEINLVIAPSFARIFKQNMFNSGMMAVELPEETIQSIFASFGFSDTYLMTDMKKQIIIIDSSGKKEEIGFSISDFNRSLVKAGGWIEYADTHYA